MIELHLERAIFSFDGTILEVFLSSEPSERYHIKWIKSAEIHVDKKGGQSIKVFLKDGGGFTTSDLPMEVQPIAAKLVAELHAGMTP
jgi:hypothetical protein